MKSRIWRVELEGPEQLGMGVDGKIFLSRETRRSSAVSVKCTQVCGQDSWFPGRCSEEAVGGGTGGGSGAGALWKGLVDIFGPDEFEHSRRSFTDQSGIKLWKWMGCEVAVGMVCAKLFTDLSYGLRSEAQTDGEVGGTEKEKRKSLKGKDGDTGAAPRALYWVIEGQGFSGLLIVNTKVLMMNTKDDVVYGEIMHSGVWLCNDTGDRAQHREAWDLWQLLGLWFRVRQAQLEIQVSIFCIWSCC